VNLVLFISIEMWPAIDGRVRRCLASCHVIYFQCGGNVRTIMKLYCNLTTVCYRCSVYTAIISKQICYWIRYYLVFRIYECKLKIL
jgi:hypothetical protein